MFKKIRLFILLIMLIQDIFAENNTKPSQEILENIIITGAVEDVAGRWSSPGIKPYSLYWYKLSTLKKY